MKRSEAKILTTHVGSLPFLSLDKGVATGDETQLAQDVAAVVARQRAIGIDIYLFALRSSGRKLVSTIFDQSTSPVSAPTSFCARIMRSMPAMSK